MFSYLSLLQLNLYYLYIEDKNQLILSLLVITQHRNCEKKKKKLQTENEGERQVFLLKKSFH